MVAYSIFLNFVEVFTLTAFVYLYYSFSNKKIFILLFCCLFLGFELCDILRENGVILMFLNFIISYSFILYERRKINFFENPDKRIGNGHDDTDFVNKKEVLSCQN